VVYSGQQLGVGRQAAVELVPGPGHQTLGKLSLEHQNGTPGETDDATNKQGKKKRPCIEY